MEIKIRNMVCTRCVMVVKQIFKQAGVTIENIDLGTITTKQQLTSDQINYVDKELAKAGFEILGDQTAILVAEIKTATIEYVYQSNDAEWKKFSLYLSSKLNKDYNYLSSLFSSFAGITIEKYLINLKIERVKELLTYQDKTLSEIAWEMNYSSVAHLLGQFKKVTGLTPTYFKNLGRKKRKSIENV